jgi:cell division GTPase FtsZ
LIIHAIKSQYIFLFDQKDYYFLKHTKIYPGALPMVNLDNNELVKASKIMRLDDSGGLDDDLVASSNNDIENNNDNRSIPQTEISDQDRKTLKNLEDFKDDYCDDQEPYEPLDLNEEILSRAANPKLVGVISSGGLSNDIIEQISSSHAKVFKEYSFKTKLEVFNPAYKSVQTKDQQIQAQDSGQPPIQTPGKPMATIVEQEKKIEKIPTDVESQVRSDDGFDEEIIKEETSLEPDDDEFIFEPEHEMDPFEEEFFESTEPGEFIGVKEEAKPLSFRERAHKVFFELKKKLGLVKVEKPDTLTEVIEHPQDEPEYEPEYEPEEYFEPEVDVEVEPEPENKAALDLRTRPVAGSGTASSEPEAISSRDSDLAGATEPPDRREIAAVATTAENKEIRELLTKGDIVFVFTCLDDDQDIENSLLISEITKRHNILTIVIASLPRYFGKVENVYVMNKVLQKLRLIAEIVILIPYYETIPFKLIPGLIHELIEIITQPGLINVDVADLKIVVKGGNVGVVTYGTGKHLTRHKDAFFEALDSELLNVELGGVRKALLNVTGGSDMMLAEVEGLAEQIKRRIRSGARFILGTSIDPKLKDKLKVFLLVGVTPMQVMVNKYAQE